MKLILGIDYFYIGTVSPKHKGVYRLITSMTLQDIPKGTIIYASNFTATLTSRLEYQAEDLFMTLKDIEAIFMGNFDEWELDSEGRPTFKNNFLTAVAEDNASDWDKNIFFSDAPYPVSENLYQVAMNEPVDKFYISDDLATFLAESHIRRDLLDTFMPVSKLEGGNLVFDMGSAHNSTYEVKLTNGYSRTVDFTNILTRSGVPLKEIPSKYHNVGDWLITEASAHPREGNIRDLMIEQNIDRFMVKVDSGNNEVAHMASGPFTDIAEVLTYPDTGTVHVGFSEDNLAILENCDSLSYVPLFKEGIKTDIIESEQERGMCLLNDNFSISATQELVTINMIWGIFYMAAASGSIDDLLMLCLMPNRLNKIMENGCAFIGTTYSKVLGYSAAIAASVDAELVGDYDE